MNIQDICNQQWYLAQYVTGGTNREKLFRWLSDQNMLPWTPLQEVKIRRSDTLTYRKRISPVFPGYFFLKADFEYHAIDVIRTHSAFCGFVRFGPRITPVKQTVVDGLMKVFPDPVRQPAAQEALEEAAGTWLTRSQYQHLITLEKMTQPVSRIALLYDLIMTADSRGF